MNTITKFFKWFFGGSWIHPQANYTEILSKVKSPEYKYKETITDIHRNHNYKKSTDTKVEDMAKENNKNESKNEESKPIKYENRLTINFIDGTILLFSIDNWDIKRKNIRNPWLKFYKWFYATDKPYFAFPSKLNSRDSETMLRRDQIKYFAISITTNSGN